jgi:hypothetical protein
MTGPRAGDGAAPGAAAMIEPGYPLLAAQSGRAEPASESLLARPLVIRSGGLLVATLTSCYSDSSSPGSFFKFAIASDPTTQALWPIGA